MEFQKPKIELLYSFIQLSSGTYSFFVCVFVVVVVVVVVEAAGSEG